ncbi:substrate-binding domain-containing protein [Amycolatopsis sp. MEPSY49]|uniref:LacI family DNA-binding transcriptional regulator n=1 Tax=Amycolatopsis sp. MEPSY49 TaxID=3151600 RepID=UPI003EF4994F
MKRPTITDIAREAGVSKGAVSYALNGRPGVSEETRHRITRIARELGWSPSSAARALSGGRSGTIGLVLDGPAEVFFPALLDGFSQELLLRVAVGHEAAVAVYRRWRAERKVDGVLLTGPDCAADVARIGLPAVVLGGPGGLPEAPSVRVDDTAGAAEALEYLAALGHRHVVRVAGAAAFADAGEREEAFTTVARRLGLLGARTAGVRGAAPLGCGGGAGRAETWAIGSPGLGAAHRGGGAGQAGTSGTDVPGLGSVRRGGGAGEAGSSGAGVPGLGSVHRGGGVGQAGSSGAGVPGLGSVRRAGRAGTSAGGVQDAGSAHRGGAGTSASGVPGAGSAHRGGAGTSASGVPGAGSAHRGGTGASAGGVPGPGSAHHRSAGGAGQAATPIGGWLDDPWRPGVWTGPGGGRVREARAAAGIWAVGSPPAGYPASAPQPAILPTEPSAEAVRRLLTADPRPTALLCDTDSLAVAALVAARELGLSVPGDLSVVSWDDSDLCRLVRPALSAVRRPLAELGGLAAAMLRDLVAGEDVGDVCASRPRLVTRGSTGPVR